MATLAPAHAPRARTGAHRVVAALSTLCGWAAAGMIVTAVGITCQMIWVRFVLNLSTVWQTEVVIYLMIGATLIGLPYVQLLRGHVNVDLLPRLLPPSVRKALAFLVFGLTLAVMGVMAWYGYELWHVAWSRGWTSDTVWGAKLWVPYLALPVGFGLYMLQLASDMLAVATGEDKPFDLDDDASFGGDA
ncbi:MAG: TRAP transporter small permease [Rhodobacteraceae bacterium]|nr:TRAP transporter small permease [Paracoccaceae bacterium]